MGTRHGVQHCRISDRLKFRSAERLGEGYLLLPGYHKFMTSVQRDQQGQRSRRLNIWTLTYSHELHRLTPKDASPGRINPLHGRFDEKACLCQVIACRGEEQEDLRSSGVSGGLDLRLRVR